MSAIKYHVNRVRRISVTPRRVRMLAALLDREEADAVEELAEIRKALATVVKQHSVDVGDCDTTADEIHALAHVISTANHAADSVMEDAAALHLLDEVGVTSIYLRDGSQFNPGSQGLGAAIRFTFPRASFSGASRESGHEDADEETEAASVALEVLCRVFEDGADVAMEEWREWYKPTDWLWHARGLGSFIAQRLARKRDLTPAESDAFDGLRTAMQAVSGTGKPVEISMLEANGLVHAIATPPRVACDPSARAASFSVIPTTVGADPERVAQLVAHRGCGSAEHDPMNGKIHGYCVVCLVPWPCEFAGKPSDFGLEQWIERRTGRLLGEPALGELDAIVAKIRASASSVSSGSPIQDEEIARAAQQTTALREALGVTGHPMFAQLLNRVRAMRKAANESAVALNNCDAAYRAKMQSEAAFDGAVARCVELLEPGETDNVYNALHNLRDAYRAMIESRLASRSSHSESDSAWPPRDVVQRLVDAAWHLAHDHNCDQHGYETLISARQAAERWLATPSLGHEQGAET